MPSKPSKHRNDYPSISESWSPVFDIVAALRAGEESGTGESELYGPCTADFS